MQKLFKNIGIVILIFLFISGIFVLYGSPTVKPDVISLSTLAQQVNEGKVKEIKVDTNNLDITLSDVLPAPRSTQKIENSDYRFFFIIKNREEAVPVNVSGSGVRGQVLLGPVCPVMRDPPDPQCADKPYATTIQVIRVGSPVSSPFATVKTDTEGNYSVSLPPGAYALQPKSGQVFPRCETKEVTVVPSKILEVNLSCDTGIR